MADTSPAESLEIIARAVFMQALLTPGKSGELLWRLFEGDGVTMDPYTRQIVYLPASEIARLAADE